MTVTLVRLAVAVLFLVAATSPVARAEHGRFDRTTPDPREEAYIFTPAGFSAAGELTVASADKAGRLHVTIVDHATGKLTPCRVNVVGSDGNFYQPRENPLSVYSLQHAWPDGLAGNRPGKAPIRYFGHFFYTPGEFTVAVPAGAVRVEVWKGLEYRVEMHSTHIATGADRDIHIELSRAVPMANEGWHSADPHLHFIRSSDADDQSIFDLLEAEDIRRGMILCYNEDTSNYKGLMPEQGAPQLRGLGLKSVRERGPFAILSGQEYRNGVLGHLNLFLRDRIYLDGAQLDPNVGPLYAAVGEETRRQGGYAFHAHGGYGLEIWADLVQGATTGAELLQFGIYRGIGLDGWYHVLNAGFRFPGIGASDYPACRKLGDCRTYAHVEGDASFPAWLKAAAEGRSFMTTGPLVLLDVDGHLPGDIVATPDKQPKSVRAKLRVRSETAPVTNVQLIVNGRVARELVVPREAGTAQWLTLDEPLDLTESSWIAARAFSTSSFGSPDAEAHTNPVYFYFGGQPPCAAADIDWLIARLDEQIADHEARQVPQKQHVIDYFRRSRELLVSRKERHLAGDRANAPTLDKAAVQTALNEPILSLGTPLQEIRTFIEPKIPAPPRPTDRQQWEADSERLRQQMLDRVVFRGQNKNWRDAPARVEWLDTIPGGEGYHIRKLRYEALPGMWIPALLYEPDRLSGKVPLVLHLNGHERVGKAVEYKQLLSINLAKRGMLVLDLEWIGMGQLATPGFSHYRMNQLDVCGASGLAPFYLSLSRALDLGLALEHADPARVAAMGLSGGGWQTILISSLDPRVVLANPVAGYGGFRSNILSDDMGDSEQAPTDMALVADYTHLTALRAGRPTLLTYNAGDDCCFKSGHTLEPLLAAARPVFALLGANDKLRSHVNHVPGTHNFEQENREAFYGMLGDFFFPGDPSFARGELPSRDCLKSAEDLRVPIPDDNMDFHRLAGALVSGMPAREALPDDRAAALTWQRVKREQLHALLKVPEYGASVISETVGAVPGAKITSRQVRCGDAWTIPSVEFVPTSEKPRGTVILIADAGRKGAAAEIEGLLGSGDRVLAIDPLGLGESTVQAQDPSYLYPLFLAAVGERPLGIQAAQVIAVARLAKAMRAQEPVTIVATGPRTSMIALVAGALGTEEIQGVELKDSLVSLADLIECDKTVEELPELFAFGMAAEFDVLQIAALVAPRQVTFREASERARREWATLRRWYATWGEAFDPLAARP